MASARQIKRRITASQNISKITRAMEMVSASKMRRAQDQAIASRPYSRALEQSLLRMSEHVSEAAHPLLEKHETGKEVVILVSTDKGLCGSLNPTLFKACLQFINTLEQPVLIAIGKKAVTFAHTFGLPLHAQFTALPEKIQAEDVLPLSTLIIDSYLSKEFKSVHLMYMNFINTLSQKVRAFPLVPLSGAKTYRDETMTVPTVRSEYIFEPSPQQILSQLLPYYLENTLFQTLLEARASEHSARMVAMKNASDNASELVDELKLVFNKSRQAGITNELLDITTAAMTMQ